MISGLIISPWRAGAPLPILSGLRPEIVASFEPTLKVFHRLGFDGRITSAFRPGDKGLHGQGLAVDWGMSHIGGHLYWSIFNAIREALGGAEPFDMQPYPETLSHIHVEWDPKPALRS